MGDTGVGDMCGSTGVGVQVWGYRCGGRGVGDTGV